MSQQNSAAENGKVRPSYFRKHNLVETQFANLGKARNRPGFRRLAYCKVEGTKRPGIIYVPGYFSKMFIAKANIIEEYCLNHGYSFIKYDPEGIGESYTESGEMSFAEWYEDACYVVEHLTDGPQMLVSSSNGAWMSLLLAKKYPDRIHSLVMLGPAVNHGLDDDLFEKLIDSLDPETARRVQAGETIKFKSNWGVEVTASKRFVEEMKMFRINMEEPVELQSTCPVRIVHSMQDQSIYWENCLQLMDAIKHDDVRLYLKKRGNHRLMAEEDMKLEVTVIEELLTNYPVAPAKPADARSNMAALPQNLMEGLFSEMGKRRTLASKSRQVMRSKL